MDDRRRLRYADDRVGVGGTLEAGAGALATGTANWIARIAGSRSSIPEADTARWKAFRSNPVVLAMVPRIP